MSNAGLDNWKDNGRTCWLEASPNAFGVPFFTDIACACGKDWTVQCKNSPPATLISFHCSCGLVTTRPVKSNGTP